MIADIGERATRIRARRLPGKLVMAAAASLFLLVASLTVQNSNSAASVPPVNYGWQPTTVYLEQTAFVASSVGSEVTATYHFTWNASFEFSKINWSGVDRTRTDQNYVLGLGMKVWVSESRIASGFPIEITQGDGTSLSYTYNYTGNRETPHIYLTGERTYWKWDRSPSMVYDYRVKGSCAIEDAWKNGTWTPEEGISLSYSPTGTLTLGDADFSMQLYVYDVMVPELGTLIPVVVLIALVIIVIESRKRKT